MVHVQGVAIDSGIPEVSLVSHVTKAGRANSFLVSFAAVVMVITWGEALRDDPNNGCEGD